MSDTPKKPLMSEHIRVLKTLCEKHPQSDLARALATIEQQAEQIERLRKALKHCSELFSEIRGDWTDPRGECREGQKIIEEALAATEPVNDKR